MNYALSNLDTLQREVSRIAGISDKEQQRASGSRQTNHVVRARARRMLSSLLIPFLINSICDGEVDHALLALARAFAVVCLGSPFRINRVPPLKIQYSVQWLPSTNIGTNKAKEQSWNRILSYFLLTFCQMS